MPAGVTAAAAGLATRRFKMARHRSYSVEFKKQVVQEGLVTLERAEVIFDL